MSNRLPGWLCLSALAVAASSFISCGGNDQQLPTTPHDSTITPITPTRLAFTTLAPVVRVNDTIPTFHVDLIDSTGAIVDMTDTVTVALDRNPGNAALIGDTVVVAMHGVATFAGIRITVPGNDYTLKALSSGMSVAKSDSIDVQPSNTPAVPHLAFDRDIQIRMAGDTIEPFDIFVEDSTGQTIMSSENDTVRLAIGANPTHGTLSGTTTAVTVHGTASFHGLSIDSAGTGYTLRATATGRTAGTSHAFTVAPRSATPGSRLNFAHTVATTQAGDTIPTVKVEIVDARNVTIGLDGDTVRIAIANNPAHGTLSGTTTAVTVQGVASFTGLRIDAPGTGYTLRATATGLADDTSASFAIVAQSPITWDSMPGAVAAGAMVALSEDDEEEHCGIAADGTVSCWGRIAGPGGNSFTPVAMAMKFSAVTTSPDFACGLTSSGEAWCWGHNADGQLGNGTTTPSTSPVAVSGGLHFTQITSGGRFACALTAAGRVYCWGTLTDPSDGGTNPADVVWTTPTAYDTARTYTSVTSGSFHTCALDQHGAAFCWGEVSYGSAGLGYDNATGIAKGSGTPKPVVGGLTFTALSAGGTGTCGLATDGHAYCWGENLANQVGSSTARSEVAQPTVVPGVPTFNAIRTGGDNYDGSTCALTSAGALWCWGATHQPGASGSAGNRAPRAIAGGTFTAITVGATSACALDQTGAAWCWGFNDNGQLGRGH